MIAVFKVLLNKSKTSKFGILYGAKYSKFTWNSCKWQELYANAQHALRSFSNDFKNRLLKFHFDKCQNVVAINVNRIRQISPRISHIHVIENKIPHSYFNRSSYKHSFAYFEYQLKIDFYTHTDVHWWK